jgi:hypothetical protein
MKEQKDRKECGETRLSNFERNFVVREPPLIAYRSVFDHPS